MKLNVRIDRDENSVCIGESPVIPRGISQGRMNEKVLANANNAIAACLQVRVTRDQDTI